MRTKLQNGIFLFTLAAILAVATLIFLPKASSQSYDKGEIIKLYSGNTLVSSWKAVTQGRMDGYTYVFNVGTKSSPIEVRVCGTFSVERVP